MIFFAFAPNANSFAIAYIVFLFLRTALWQIGKSILRIFHGLLPEHVIRTTFIRLN